MSGSYRYKTQPPFERGLGRVESVPDRRNALFPVRNRLMEMELARPRSYTWPLALTLDQGQTSACVGNAYTHELAAMPVAVKGLDQNFAQGYYREARQRDEIEGEDYDGTTMHGGVRVGMRMGHYANYWWIQTEEELATVVGHKGPVPIGVLMRTGMMMPNSRLMLTLRGSIEGGHAMLVTGISLTRSLYKIKNSWGPEWGVDGTAYISRGDMAVLLEEGGEMIYPERKKVAA